MTWLIIGQFIFFGTALNGDFKDKAIAGDANLVVAKHLEGEVGSRRATQVERILAVVVDNNVGVVVDPQVTDELGDLFGRRQLPRHLVNHRSPTTFQVIGIDRARDVALQVKRTRAPIQRIADIEYPYVVIARVLLDPIHVNERCC